MRCGRLSVNSREWKRIKGEGRGREEEGGEENGRERERGRREMGEE